MNTLIHRLPFTRRAAAKVRPVLPETIDAQPAIDAHPALEARSPEAGHAVHAPDAAVLHLDQLMGPDAWARLPAAVRRRFDAHAAAVCYRGRMDLRCSRLGRLLAWLAWPLRGPLLPHCAKDVAAEVTVSADGQGGVVWSRHMGRRTVQSVKRAHPEHGVLERTRGGLAMALDVFEDQGALVFQSRHYLWCLGPVRLRLPDWLSPGCCRVEHRDLGDGRFRFTLTMTHPRWGLTFEQTGDFVDPVQEC
ncbi:DUF4166 domain-containing protein [Roseateles amylovorans]|uniref:DUF4166 domain-containing protein n=1 Tax=Roseateles amylovorans TaxID=2978473 RepID=A0ABY6AVW7_9BURK|nr:DUF4166 domain-containing protein [Roseateles amylovorans]UXH77142.1 DUF4166 domain-containing protein [Roseateles amylovorans]